MPIFAQSNQKKYTLQIDEQYMKRCFELAKLGEEYVAPNPMVGAVLVYQNKIIGEGYHQSYGSAHAEVNCINSVAENNLDNIQKSTLYVSLEPCSHFGKTPPCVDLIIKNQIKKVVVSVLDPNPIVAGNGIKKLKENGIEVIIGILENEGKKLLKKFYNYHHTKKTYITLKYAESMDNFLGIKDKCTKISNSISDIYVHQLRATHQAILIGKNTLTIDNPKLDVRHYFGNIPIKIILTTDGNIDLNYNIFKDKQTPIIIVNQNIEKKEINIEWLKVNNIYNLDEVLETLYNKNIQSILVEGGSKILNTFIEQNKWNQIYKITSDTKLNDGVKAPTIQQNSIEMIEIKKNTIYKYINNTY